METGETEPNDFEKELDAIKGQLIELQKEIDQNDEEIDSLQIQAMEARIPWYRNASTAIAVLAFVFSLITTGFSFYLASQQRVTERKAELRILIQRINELNGEISSLTSNFTSETARSRFPIVFSELSLLAYQANEIIQEIPHRISSVEYYTVGNAYVQLTQLDQAQELYEAAVRASNTLESGATSYRTLAGFLMSNGKLEEGRIVYNDAMKVIDTFPSNFPAANDRQKMYNYIHWASSELGQNQCEDGEKLLKEGSKMATEMKLFANDPFFPQLKALEESLKTCRNIGS